MSKNKAQQQSQPSTKPASTPQSAPPPTTVSMTELVEKIRAASTSDDAVGIIAPKAKSKPKLDAIYEINLACTEPPPSKGGLAALVFVTAARMNKPFKLSDIETALPEKKAVRYWVRQLAKSGYLTVSAN